MTKRGTKAVNGDQGAFAFAAERNPAEVAADFKHALTRAIKRCGKSRAALAEHLSRITGEGISETQINNWTAESKSHNIPAELIAPICAWCGDWRPMQVLLEPYRQHVIDEKRKTLMEFGELYIEEHSLKAKHETVQAKVHRAFFSGAQG